MCNSFANCDLFLPSNPLDHITGAPGAKVRHCRILRHSVCVDMSVYVIVMLRVCELKHLQLNLYLSQTDISATGPVVNGFR